MVGHAKSCDRLWSKRVQNSSDRTFDVRSLVTTLPNSLCDQPLSHLHAYTYTGNVLTWLVFYWTPQNVDKILGENSARYLPVPLGTYVYRCFVVVVWVITGETPYITRSLGPQNFVCYIRYFIISVVYKHYKTAIHFIGTGENCCIMLFLFRSLYIKFPLNNKILGTKIFVISDIFYRSVVNKQYKT